MADSSESEHPDEQQPPVEVGDISDLKGGEVHIAGRDVRKTEIRAGTYIEHATFQAEPGRSAEEDAPAPGDPPYKGLQYFDVADAELFFGREALTAELAGRLRETRFLAVVGASGSGKSSVVRAGVVPALQQGGELADGSAPPQSSDRWQVHIITPTASPLKELAASLTSDVETVTATATLMDDLASDSRSLDLAVTRRLRRTGGEKLLLVVDQFEELFTLCKDEAERQAFVENLLTAVAEEKAGPTIMVITLRADFYHHCAQFDALRLALEKHQAFIGPLSAGELRQAIEGPAQAGEWSLENGLVDLMLRDAGDEPGALPLLSHALLETWRRRSGRTLTLAGYSDAGGVHGAIATTADRVYEGLSAEQQAIARNIFLRLTELGEGTQDTRRRASISELTSGSSPVAELQAVLKTLADRRLVTTEQDTAEVAHEALIREWPRLHQWLEENRDSLRLHRRISDAAAAWERNGRAPEWVYSGRRLQRAVEWSQEHAGEMSAQERDFLQHGEKIEYWERRAMKLRTLPIPIFIGIALFIAYLALTGRFDRLRYRPLPLEMVTIPAGTFMMGGRDPNSPISFLDEFPSHNVFLDSYQIGVFEVTNQQYLQCVLAGICAPPNNREYDQMERSDHPVEGVSWQDAVAFCEWSDARLPTEAEWEKAARGGLEGMLYPWGDEYPTCQAGAANGARVNNLGCDLGTRPVGGFSPNGYGLYDMAGNVSEWVADWYDPYYYSYLEDGVANPHGPDTGDWRVKRGGSWFAAANVARTSVRSYGAPLEADRGYGFRCARSP